MGGGLPARTTPIASPANPITRLCAQGPDMATLVCCCCKSLRGPAAILFISCETSSESIAKLFRVCFLWGIVRLSRDMLQNGVLHRCACVNYHPRTNSFQINSQTIFSGHVIPYLTGNKFSKYFFRSCDLFYRINSWVPSRKIKLHEKHKSGNMFSGHVTHYMKLNKYRKQIFRPVIFLCRW